MTGKRNGTERALPPIHPKHQRVGPNLQCHRWLAGKGLYLFRLKTQTLYKKRKTAPLVLPKRGLHQLQATPVLNLFLLLLLPQHILSLAHIRRISSPSKRREFQRLAPGSSDVGNTCTTCNTEGWAGCNCFPTKRQAMQELGNLPHLWNLIGSGGPKRPCSLHRAW